MGGVVDEQQIAQFLYTMLMSHPSPAPLAPAENKREVVWPGPTEPRELGYYILPPRHPYSLPFRSTDCGVMGSIIVEGWVERVGIGWISYER